MALYAGNTATESNSAKYEVGGYKFRVLSAEMNSWGGLNYQLETKDGPKVYDTLNFSTQSDAVKAEIDRKLTTLLGKVTIDAPEEILGKVGYVVLRQGPKYLEPMPFGGYFNENKKSATGNAESFDKAVAEAKAYDWTQDAYAVKKHQDKMGNQGHLSNVDTDSDSDPF